MSATQFTPPVPPLENERVLELLRGLAHLSLNYLRDLARLFRAELREKSRSLRIVAALAAAAAILLAASFLWLSLALMAAIAYGLGSWGWSLFIVGVVYGLLGLALLLPLAHGLRGGIARFERTADRVKQDSEWIKRKLAA